MGRSMSKPLDGIQGILGSYVSTPAAPPIEHTKPAQKKLPAKSNPATRNRSRLGRPPRKSSEPTAPKEKATLRIDTELMADYRDWSWDERCQLGELVEKALTDYRRRNR